MAAGNSQDQDRMGGITLAGWMWFVDILVKKCFKHRSKVISQAQIRRSYLILEAFAAALGVLPKVKNHNLPA